MALFIGALAFPDGALLEEAKLAVLVASAVALVLALVLGRVLPTPSGAHRDAEATAPDATSRKAH
jgi:Na+/H+ antiporter NhaA